VLTWQRPRPQWLEFTSSRHPTLVREKHGFVAAGGAKTPLQSSGGLDQTTGGRAVWVSYGRVNLAQRLAVTQPNATPGADTSKASR